MKRFVSLFCALAGAAACGDNLNPGGGDDDQDAVQVDAPNPDARPIDATDAPPAATHVGTITLLEAAVLAPGGGSFFGQGLQVGISFVPLAGPQPTIVMEQSPGQPTGCKLFEFTPEQLGAQIGTDEGPVDFTITGGTAQAAIPSCTFTAGVGYSCPDLTTASTGGVIAPVTTGPLAGLAGSITDTDNTFTDANSLGRYVRINGAATGANNGVFPILAVAAANTIVYGNPAAAVETLPGTASHVNIAGVGPIPSAADPGFLQDANGTMVAHTMGGGNNVEDFTQMTTNVGDDFVLATGDNAKLTSIPTTGTAADLVISCVSGSCGSGSAMGMLVNIISTDTAVPTPVNAGNFFAFPAPTTKRKQIRCSMIGGVTSITVPAAYMAAMIDPSITRIQTTVMRPALLGIFPTSPSNTLVGHATVGFTTPP